MLPFLQAGLMALFFWPSFQFTGPPISNWACESLAIGEVSMKTVDKKFIEAPEFLETG